MGHSRRVDRRTPPLIGERLSWLVAVLVGLVVLADGLAKNFYIEPTSDALSEAAVGVRLIWASSVVLVVASAYAWWRGAPAWSWLLVLSAPVVCGGLMALWSESLFPQLAFLVVGPVAGLAALVGALLRWRPRNPASRAVRPAR